MAYLCKWRWVIEHQCSSMLACWPKGKCQHPNLADSIQNSYNDRPKVAEEALDHFMAQQFQLWYGLGFGSGKRKNQATMSRDTVSFKSQWGGGRGKFRFYERFCILRVKGYLCHLKWCWVASGWRMRLGEISNLRDPITRGDLNGTRAKVRGWNYNFF